MHPPKNTNFSRRNGPARSSLRRQVLEINFARLYSQKVAVGHEGQDLNGASASPKMTAEELEIPKEVTIGIRSSRNPAVVGRQMLRSLVRKFRNSGGEYEKLNEPAVTPSTRRAKPGVLTRSQSVTSGLTSLSSASPEKKRRYENEMEVEESQNPSTEKENSVRFPKRLLSRTKSHRETSPRRESSMLKKTNSFRFPSVLRYKRSSYNNNNNNNTEGNPIVTRAFDMFQQDLLQSLEDSQYAVPPPPAKREKLDLSDCPPAPVPRRRAWKKQTDSAS